MSKTDNLISALEAMLFAAGDPVEAVKLAEVLDIDIETVTKMLGHLSALYDERNSGLMLIKIDNKYQLCTREQYSEEVRGVDRSGPISSLVQKGLIEEKGRLDLPGRPLIYGTTDRFLRCFSLNSLEDLPELPKTEEVEKITADTSQTSLFDDENKSAQENILIPNSESGEK